MMAGIELQNYGATVHEMSNQQSEKQSFSPTQTWIALWKLVDTYDFAASPF